MDRAEGKSSSAANEAEPLSQSINPFNALAATWNTWLQAANSLSLERGAELGKSLSRLFDPQFWNAGELRPLIAELQEALSLPTLADLPRMDLSMLPAPTAMLDLARLMQKFLSVSIPVWAAASQRFQAEADARRQKGEPVRSPADALELWNAMFDRTLMEFNRSNDFARMQQELLRAAAQFRLALRKIGEASARSFDMPTRQEITDVYRRMHDMQREMHRLRQEVRALQGAAGAGVAAESAAC